MKTGQSNSEYVRRGEIDPEGRIKYSFAFGVEYGCDMNYQEYLAAFEQAKDDINFEELLNSKEGLGIKKFCKEPKTPKEIRTHLGINSRISFDKGILKPLFNAGKLGLIRGKNPNDWRYYWNNDK